MCYKRKKEYYPKTNSKTLEITKRNTEVLPNVNNNFSENSLNESLPNVNEHKDVQRIKRTAAANVNAKTKLINEDDEYMLYTILLWGV